MVAVCTLRRIAGEATGFRRSTRRFWTEMSRMYVRCIFGVMVAAASFAQSGPRVPMIWNEEDLKEWATPLAQIEVRPGHFSSAEYYSTPADNLRTYPVYPPYREPPGYWEWLNQQKPEPLVDVSSIKT